jgi:arylsulfatase A-like enzyme
MEMDVSKTFARDEVRETVLGAYMGLIKQVDDHLGRLFEELESSGRMDDTLIVVTSDHGDYLGDHWLGEKELFHDQSMRVPLVIRDPRTGADTTRGSVCDAMVEAIDLLPTFLDACGIDESRHRLEGRSLCTLLAGEKPVDWRDHAFSEIDYSFYQAGEKLGVDFSSARAYAIRMKNAKYIHFKGFRPQLFDLEADPQEFRDLGASAHYATLIREMQSKLLERLTDRRNRITLPDEAIPAMRPHRGTRGIAIGRW